MATNYMQSENDGLKEPVNMLEETITLLNDEANILQVSIIEIHKEASPLQDDSICLFDEYNGLHLGINLWHA